MPKLKEKAIRYYPKEKNKIEVWNENLRKLKSWIPIITGVDSYYLEYTPYYKTSHGFHTVILTGYSEEEQRINIIDSMAPWFYKGSMDFENFIEARNFPNEFDGGIYSGVPILNNWEEVDNDGWNADVLELIKSNIRLSIKQCYDEPGDGKNNYKGINVLSRIVDILKDVNDIDIDKRRNYLQRVYIGLYAILKRKMLFKRFILNSYKKQI